MIFASRMAKLGRSTNINMFYNADSQTFNVYVSGKGVQKKELAVKKDALTLSNSKKEYVYNEVIQFSPQFAVARIDNSFSIIKVVADSGT